MPQIIVTAAVNDVEEWLKFKAEMVPRCRLSRRTVPATSPPAPVPVPAPPAPVAPVGPVEDRI